jgi:hypothetical protein
VCRLHSALSYRSPEDFEKEFQRESQRTSAAAMMTFFEGYCGHLRRRLGCTSLSQPGVQSVGFLLELNCARTVRESNVFIPFGLLLSERQIARFVGNVRSDGRSCWSRVRCAQGRRAAIR